VKLENHIAGWDEGLEDAIRQFRDLLLNLELNARTGVSDATRSVFGE